MTLSDWQARLIRARLVSYREVEGRRQGLKRGLPWKTISTEISWPKGVAKDSTEERLRQFVNGIPSRKGNGREFPVPQDGRLEAIADFLMADRIKMLDPAELEEIEGAVPHFVQMMAESDNGVPSVELARNLQGEFRKIETKRNTVFNQTLSFFPSGNNRVFEVRYAGETFTAAGGSEDVRNWPASLRKRSLRSRRTAHGWLIISSSGKAFGILSEIYKPSQFLDLIGLYLSDNGKTVSLAKTKTDFMERIIDQPPRVNPNFDKVFENRHDHEVSRFSATISAFSK